MNFEDSFNQGEKTKQNSFPVHSCHLDMFNPWGYFSVLQILTQFHTRFQTWRVKIPVFGVGL